MNEIPEPIENELDPKIIEGQYSSAVRELSGNLLRVIRGAGQPEKIGTQAAKLVELFDLFFKAHGHYPFSGQYAEYLSAFPSSAVVFSMSEQDQARALAEHKIIRASLQIVASGLLGQPTQKSIAQSDFLQGLNDMIKARDSQRKTFKRSQNLSD